MPERVPTVAVIGASADRSKYGNKAVRAYRKRGWTVYPVNPSATEIEGLAAFASVDEIPGPVDRVTLYLPPASGVGVLEAIAAKRPAEFFVNPGAESDELVNQAQALGLDPILACSIVEIGESPDGYT
ncbi:MAG: CoA-binding protein [Phycisphaerae bacterium]